MSAYLDFDVSRFIQIPRTRLIISWEMAPDTFLGGKLTRPESFRGIHYTGHIIMMGEDVSLIKEDINVVLEYNDRILFEGLMNSALEKFDDPKLGRCCLIDEDELMAWLMDDRVKVVDVEGDYDYGA